MRNKSLIPRTLLKNGKRSASVFIAARASDSPPDPTDCQGSAQCSPQCTQQTLTTMSPPNQHCDEHVTDSHSCTVIDSRAITTLNRELSALRQEVTDLKSDVLGLKNKNTPETCSLYVRIRSLKLDELCEASLSALLKCPVVCYSIIRGRSTISLRVIILKLHLHTALTSAVATPNVVRLWQSGNTRTLKEKSTESSTTGSLPPLSSDQSINPSLTFVTWNCRGLSSGEPYIHQLAECGNDVIVVGEHWLWPYETERLANIHPAFSADVKTDRRLTEESTLRRGCGGIGIMWRKTLDATPIPSISSDRICGLSIRSSNQETVFSVIGVYLPCADLGIEYYCEHLMELERLISDQQQQGPVIVMGDFNAHLGTLGGCRGVGDPNQQGMLLQQLITRCNLYAVSLSSLATGPQYTFKSGISQTTVDYILASHDSSHYVQKCCIHPPAPLNCSDHLPISVLLRCCHALADEPLPKKRVNWSEALKSRQLLYGYQMQVSSIVTPLIGNSYSCCEDLNKEITLVANAICSCAERLLLLCKGPAKKKHWYKDQTLSQLAIKKREAWDKWSSNGRPKEGFLYDAKIRTRAEFRKRLRVCAANNERKRIQHFDRQFKQRSSNRFKLPLRRKQQGTALRLNCEVVTDQHTLLKAWEEHFQEISSKHSEQTSEMTCSD